MNCFLVGGLILLSVGVQDEIDSELVRQVTAILRRLDTDDEEQSRDAEKSLLEIGPAASSFLDSIVSDLPTETQQVVARVQTEWDKQRTGKMLQATKVNLRGKMSVAKALEAIGKQAGIEIIGAEQVVGEVEMSAHDVEFWRAFDQALSGTSVRIYPYGAEAGGLRVVASEDAPSRVPPPVCYDGPFRVEAIRCEATRDFSRPSASQLRVVLGLQWEPRLRPIAFQQPTNEIEAVGDTSEINLVPQNKGVIVESTVQPEIPYAEMTLPFELAAATTTQISTLTGTIYAIVPGATETFEFQELDDKSSGKEIRKGGLVVQLEYFGAEDTIFAVRIRLKFDNANGALESYRGWVSTSEIELQDGMGTVYKPIGSEVSLLSESEAAIKLLFANDPTSNNLVVRSPTNIHRVPIKIDLRNLILP